MARTKIVEKSFNSHKFDAYINTCYQKGTAKISLINIGFSKFLS